MKTLIYLIRHGDIYNPKDVFYGASVDVPLSNEGKKQIVFVGESLKNNGIKPYAIYCSDHIRGIQSATILKKILNVKIKIKKDKRLRDVLHKGLEKYSIRDFEKRYKGKDYYKDKDLIPELKNIKIEQPYKLVKRMKSAIDDIRNENEGKIVIIIVHGYPSAFYIWSILKNASIFPSVSEIIKAGIYLGKGGGMKLEFDGKNLIGSKRLNFKEVY